MRRHGFSGRRLSLPLGWLVRMRRARLVRILPRLAGTFRRFDRVSVVPLIGRELCRGFFLLIDHERDPNSPLPGNVPAGMR
jgi:hypothetical protein